MSLPARLCCPTSENSVIAKFAENDLWANIRLCEVALSGHRPRSARHGSTGREAFHFGVHVSGNSQSSTLQPSASARRGKAQALRTALLRRRSLPAGFLADGPQG